MGRFPFFFFMAQNALDMVRVRRLVPGRWELRYLDRVDSTNRAARGAQHGTVVLTDFQESGRGRRGRSWLAPQRSSVLMSIVLDLPARVVPSDASMLAALAVRDALTETSGLEVAFKWPNDIVVGGSRKLAGILIEATLAEEEWRVRLGIGINGNFKPADVSELPPHATSIQEETGRPVDREVLIAALLMAIGRRYETLLTEPDVLFEEWKAGLVTLGRSVLVETVGATWEGRAVGVDRNGALRVSDVNGIEHAILAADVSIRRAPGLD